MKKGKVSMSELIKKNKEELLNDKALMEKIEKRMDEKHLQLNK
ncbi:FbpB family small basic protein [Lederbergia lenta]|nr:FbpB family small basic protein [Lederbergia lenta]MCM3112399.1 FbpB family small basic protein [Lederbergia lenta]